MILNVTNDVNAQAWDAEVRALGGSIFHAAEWAAYVLAGNRAAGPQYLRLTADDGTPLGIALGFRARSPKKMAAALTSRLWLDAMPVVKNNDDVLLAQFIERLIEHAQAAGDVVVEVGSFASIAGETPLRSLGFALTRRFEFELDLSASEDSLWNGMEYKRRKNIRKAERSGLVIEDLEREEGVVSLRRLQGASSERIVARGGTDITFKGEEDDDPVAMLLDSGVARIVGARLDGEVISAGLFSHFNGLVYHTLSGHNETALATQAPTLLLWKTILRYRAEGAGRFNFGGCPASAADEGDPSHGVYVYKMGFGGRRLECFSGRRVLRRFAYGTVRGLKRLLGR